MTIKYQIETVIPRYFIVSILFFTVRAFILFKLNVRTFILPKSILETIYKALSVSKFWLKLTLVIFVYLNAYTNYKIVLSVILLRINFKFLVFCDLVSISASNKIIESPS